MNEAVATLDEVESGLAEGRVPRAALQSAHAVSVAQVEAAETFYKLLKEG